ncbi:hypothetical protein F3Y22_tig00110676pilonHSYRG00197 [Hibiscus syriacus]|uniref:Uncharacterized protein n=1 Tax=Hibiscus syriacus TaxID=106335 RepID=A0A6A2ZWW9_HIBSY|nr:hypothetical protein F3Y22_tig00110676pilonHSYRG00197 [Hibiscus syriacus]
MLFDKCPEARGTTDPHRNANHDAEAELYGLGSGFPLSSSCTNVTTAVVTIGDLPEDRPWGKFGSRIITGDIFSIYPTSSRRTVMSVFKAFSKSLWVEMETNSPTAMLHAPASAPASPERIMGPLSSFAAPIRSISDAVESNPSLAPRMAA